ncbi:ANK_REP_REGION domain-containing protein [Trichonephila clavata]|uniref:ANK_REP_REGION domain-containing protein n=1 Tax=Trichonephila clavata TaxID=2740835 RepID=A0A8X6M3X7_TRICU|nr:ANK_REP_REGION domain-containing protein [Trichonephila clavata]
MSRTKDANGRMNPKLNPVVIEFEGESYTADEAIAQTKNKYYLYNLSIRTKAEDAVIVGVAKGEQGVTKKEVIRSKESLSPLVETLSPFKGLIKKEVDFQAIIQGLFINGKTENGKEIRVNTEPNLSPQGRMDLGLSFTQLSESDGSLIEDDPIIVELKQTTSGSDASRQLKQAERQVATLIREADLFVTFLIKNSTISDQRVRKGKQLSHVNESLN